MRAGPIKKVDKSKQAWIEKKKKNSKIWEEDIIVKVLQSPASFWGTEIVIFNFVMSNIQVKGAR